MRSILALIFCLLAAPALAAVFSPSYEPATAWERGVLARADQSMMFRGAAWGDSGSLWLAVKFPENFVKNAVVLDQVCRYAADEGAPSGTLIIVTYWNAIGTQTAGKAWCKVGGKLGFE